ncbi:MAG TPA: glucuronate isomerase [Trueperaceae bacterium]|nr:glucuronate isomerase [Trueperaceae bacterium]
MSSAIRSPATAWRLDPDRCFSPDPSVRARARDLYASVRDLPIVSPHGHVQPELLADPSARFKDPADLFIVPDHYVFRMLHSQGVRLEDLGVPTLDGSPVESDPRTIWRTFCTHFHLFTGTPTGLWLKAELIDLFGVDVRPSADTADELYDHIDAQLALPGFTPRALFERFDIELLATTDAATDDLAPLDAIQAAGLPVVPTFRPDALMALHDPAWAGRLALLGERVGSAVTDLAGFLAALGSRREFFKSRGATATDHGVFSSFVEPLTTGEAERLFARALAGTADSGDAERFHSHMLYEMAGMACDDGLVMQLHVGSRRNHNGTVYARFGPDKGADIPVAVDFTRGLHTLLNAYGNDPRFHLITYTLDEATYARELAPLAGHYPAMRLGAPWWFFDSVLGFERYLDRVVETAGIYNLAGFNDDTRAFPSIRTRHDVWRRTVSSWVAGMVERGLVDEEAAVGAVEWLAYGAAREAYRLG